MATAAGETQHIVVGHFFHEADTAGTKDAPFVIQGNPRPEVNVLWLLNLLFPEA